MSLSSPILLFFSLILIMKKTFISIEVPIISFMSLYIPMNLMIDWMSLMFMFSISMISSMIIMFSSSYIPFKEHKQFIFMMLMFILSMNILIISNNLIFILLGWDGLGFSSYILVIYYQNFSSSASGSITFITNRIGDILILISISIMTSMMNWSFSTKESYSSLLLIFITLSACTKSAQFPFSAWLPAAMAAPTPISALVHSSTLVTAGVYLLIRTFNPNLWFQSSLLLSLSLITITMSSMTANWEQDMKKIIALSTLSQMALMMFAISINAILLSFIHLITHAFFKSTMFLCAGIMIHNSNYQDMRMMGLNMNNSPLTNSIMGMCSLSLMGMPFMSGFYSKDSIIEFMLSSTLNNMLTLLMLASVMLTSIYSIRLISFTNKFSMKSKPEFNFHYNLNYSMPIMLLSLMSIMLGSTILWMMSPEQLFLMPQYMKTSILLEYYIPNKYLL
uniref:NADH:ubiquinone reductase (H(+)-translocating) n=1 Tax=Goeldia sp. DPP-2018 TaxID=2136113 RepID=A0A2U8XCA2_9ARAC|nr:NADH dehydrogenase subunit 5 [Goeldia sp. DPP-2018]